MDMNTHTIREILRQYGVTPQKSKGQSFLIDERVAEREVEYLDLSPDEVVLEVGPGTGTLTQILVGRAKVVAIELEEGLCDYLEFKFGDSISLIRGDALRIPFPHFDKFISNLPYSISSPLIFKLLDHRFRRGIVMVQREFAERMTAAPGDRNYSRLSVNIYYRARCEIVEIVPRTRFWPVPDVDSAIVLLEPTDPPFQVKDEKLFFWLVDLLFQQRRKKIGTVLKKRKIVDSKRLDSLPFVEERVEALTPEEIGELADAIAESN